MRNADVLSSSVLSSSTAPFTRIRVMAIALGAAAAAFALAPSGASAQARDSAEITISKPPGGYGAYGPSLPGVYMAQTSGVAPTPQPGSPQMAYSWVQPYPELMYDPNPVGWVDGWHGTVGEGIPIP